MNSERIKYLLNQTANHFENPELTGTYAVLLSNRTDWSAKKILATYLQRWPIETFYQDSKGHLGLDKYRMGSTEAIQKHWCLVTLAYSLLHLACLPSSRSVRQRENSHTPHQNHWASLSSTGTEVDSRADFIGS